MGTIIKIQLSNGTTRTFIDEQVISCNIIKAHDPLMTELQIGTVDVVLYSQNDEFNFLNPDNITVYLSQGQKLTVLYEFPDDVIKQIGLFYIDTFNNEEKNQIRITGYDAIGLLENTEFRGDFTEYAHMYPYPIQDLFKASGYDGQFIVRGALAEGGWGAMLNLYPPITTAKELVQQIQAPIGVQVIINREGIPILFDAYPDFFPRLF